MWFDATGKRLEPPFFPAFDSLGTLKRVLSTGHDYSWFVLTSTIAAKEFVLSGSEQNPDFTSKSIRAVLKNRRGGKADRPRSQAFLDNGEDFIVREQPGRACRGMNALTGDNLIDHQRLHAQIEARDPEVGNAFRRTRRSSPSAARAITSATN